MRIISQNGTLDFPYSNIALSTGYRGDKKKYYIFANCVNCEQRSQIIASYSSESKAENAMEMLHEQYRNLCNVKILACGSTEYMEKCLSESELKEILKTYEEMNIFQFPKDEDVEVQQ